MIFRAFLLFCLPVINAIPDFNHERQCSMKATNLWLDIVVVIDNSALMTNDNLDKASTNIVEVFSNVKRLGTNYDDPRSTRVAIVTYNQNATILADFNDIQSFHDLFTIVRNGLASVVNSNRSNLVSGLTLARQIFNTNRANNYRANYKQAVIIYTNTWQTENKIEKLLSIASALHHDGVNIQAIDFGNPVAQAVLRQIADEQYTYDQFLTDNLLYFLTQIICFCLPGWSQFTPSFFAPSGTCQIVSSAPANWMNAKFLCQSLNKNGYLAAEFDIDKFRYLNDLALNATGVNNNYHIGLNYVNGGWYWQQPAGQTLLTADPPYQEETFWLPDYPVSPQTNIGGAVVRGDDGRPNGWKNINAYTESKYYICETYACDANNYCP